MMRKYPRPVRLSFVAIGILLLLGLLEPIICNHNPLICRHADGLKVNVTHSLETDCRPMLRAVIPYSYSTLDLANAKTGPFAGQKVESWRYRHHLGTDNLGRDTLAGMVHGLRLAAFLGFFVTLGAFGIGLLLAIAATLQYIQPRKFSIWLWLLASLVAWYCSFLLYFNCYDGKDNFTYLSICIVSFAVLVLAESKWSGASKVSMDQGVLKTIEVLKTLPNILIIIVVSASLAAVSYWTLAALLALLLWPSYTRILRGEFLKISGTDIVNSAKVVGGSTWRIYIRHLLPNTLTPVVAYICFSLVTIVLLEATLSYLGIGIPIEEVSLGSMIKESRNNIKLWWLALFPGSILLILLVSLNTLGTYFVRQK